MTARGMLAVALAGLVLAAVPAAAGGWHGQPYGRHYGGWHGGWRGYPYRPYGFSGGPSVYFGWGPYVSPYYYPYYPYPYWPPYPSYPPPGPPVAEPQTETGSGAPDTEDDASGDAARPAPDDDAERVTYGLVQLRGVPDGAAVDLDGRFWLTARGLDARWLAVPRGAHRITVRIDQAEPLEQRVTIDAGRASTVRFRAPRPRS